MMSGGSVTIRAPTPLGADAGTAGDEVEHFLLDPPNHPAADADRLREPGFGHQRVEGRAGQRGHAHHVAGV